MLASEIRPVFIHLLLAFSAIVSGGGAAAEETGSQGVEMVRMFPQDHEDRWSASAICYGPHRDGQRPGGPTPTAAQIHEDILLIHPHWSMLRLYGSSEFGQRVLEAIRSTDIDLGVILGIWIAPEEERDDQGAVLEKLPDAVTANQREVDSAIALAAAYPDIVQAVCVGNETQVDWSAHRVPIDTVLRYIRHVRAAVTAPVTTADDYQYWRKSESRVLAKEIDFLFVHAHPLWNGQPLEKALPWLREQLAAVQAVHPDRQVIIGETGWATSKSNEGEQARLMKGVAGEAQQAVFYDTVCEWASAERVITFFFEAFDENWKGGSDPSDAEKHWGLFKADRTPKAAIR